MCTFASQKPLELEEQHSARRIIVIQGKQEPQRQPRREAQTILRFHPRLSLSSPFIGPGRTSFPHQHLPFFSLLVSPLSHITYRSHHPPTSSASTQANRRKLGSSPRLQRRALSYLSQPFPSLVTSSIIVGVLDHVSLCAGAYISTYGRDPESKTL